MAKFKNCKFCHDKFKVTKDRRFYCCDECRRLMTGRRKKEKELQIKSNYKSFAEIERRCRELGISYGKYVQLYGV